MKNAISRSTSNASIEKSLMTRRKGGGVDREEAYKFVIASATTIALISIFCMCIVVPSLIYSIFEMKTFVRSDFDYCQTSTQAAKSELDDINTSGIIRINRTIRSEGDGGHHEHEHFGYGAALASPAFQECPACCQPGPVGPPGDPGLPAVPGAAGPDGAGGRPGTTPNSTCLPERVFEPPPCLPCPQGPRGPPGHPGFPGDMGDPGILGRPGYEIAQGPQGPAGPPGQDGGPGAPGPLGDKGPTPEAKLLPGPPGNSGDSGAWGIPGHAGTPGSDGLPGPAGEKGFVGENGTPGPPGGFGAGGPAGEVGPVGTQGTCVCQDTEVIVQDTRGLIPAPDLSYYPQPPPTLPPLPVYQTHAPVYGQPPPSPGYGNAGPNPVSGPQFNYKDLPDVSTAKKASNQSPVEKKQAPQLLVKSSIDKKPELKQKESKTDNKPASQPSQQPFAPYYPSGLSFSERRQRVNAPRNRIIWDPAPSQTPAVSFGDYSRNRGYTVSGRRYGRPD